MTQNIVQYSSPFILQVSLGLCNSVSKVEEFLQPAIEFKKFKLHMKSKEPFTIYDDKTGNALERMQRVQAPADLWDITFCTR